MSCCLVNVYGPSSIPEKGDLWDRINTVIQQNDDCYICVTGGFNAIRYVNERCGITENPIKREIEQFGEFIREANLTDEPLADRKYTCYK